MTWCLVGRSSTEAVSSFSTLFQESPQMWWTSWSKPILTLYPCLHCPQSPLLRTGCPWTSQHQCLPSCRSSTPSRPPPPWPTSSEPPRHFPSTSAAGTTSPSSSPLTRHSCPFAQRRSSPVPISPSSLISDLPCFSTTCSLAPTFPTPPSSPLLVALR